MKVLRDWVCRDCGYEFEALIPAEKRVTRCRECGKTAEMVVSAPHISWLRMGVDPGFPGAADKWASAHEQKQRIEAQKKREHGTYE